MLTRSKIYNAIKIMTMLVQKVAAANNKCIGLLQITWTASPFFDMIAALNSLSALLLLYCIAVWKFDVLDKLLRAVFPKNSLMMDLMGEATPLRLHKLPKTMRPL